MLNCRRVGQAYAVPGGGVFKMFCICFMSIVAQKVGVVDSIPKWVYVFCTKTLQGGFPLGGQRSMTWGFRSLRAGNEL